MSDSVKCEAGAEEVIFLETEASAGSAGSAVSSNCPEAIASVKRSKTPGSWTKPVTDPIRR